MSTKLTSSNPLLATTIVCLLSLSFSSLAYEDGPPYGDGEVRPPRSGFDVYLVMGQSNAQGWQDAPQWIPSDYDTIAHILKYNDLPDGSTITRIYNGQFVVRNTTGFWLSGVEPIGAGVCPARGCAKVLVARDTATTFGMAMRTVGATSISRWVKGGDLYDGSLKTAREVMAWGNLRGVLWHQGENDVGNMDATWWGNQLKSLISDMRADLGLPDLIFVIGELGQFVGNGSRINSQIPGIVSSTRLTAIVFSAGLASQGDNLHFSSDAQREFGRRYGEALVSVLATMPAVAVQPSRSSRTPRPSMTVRSGAASSPLRLYDLRGAAIRGPTVATARYAVRMAGAPDTYLSVCGVARNSVPSR
jgi:hypothetical protein